MSLPFSSRFLFLPRSPSPSHSLSFYLSHTHSLPPPLNLSFYFAPFPLDSFFLHPLSSSLSLFLSIPPSLSLHVFLSLEISVPIPKP